MNKLEWILFLVHPDRSHLVLRIEELFNRRRLFGARVCTPTHSRLLRKWHRHRVCLYLVHDLDIISGWLSHGSST